MPASATLTQAQHNAVRELLRVAPVAVELGERFAAAGHTLHLVGGSVRDALLGRLGDDLDFTTGARPEAVLEIVEGWAEATWATGLAFGTVGVSRRGLRLEITTYRAESYEPGSRNPQVSYGDSLTGDLARRDFTVNAMAIAVPDWRSPDAFVDPYGGREDLTERVLRTPGAPEDSFGDDPLRMLRAARFVSQLGFAAAPEVVEAMQEMVGRLEIVSVERITAELSKLLLGAHPRAGLELLVRTGLAERVLPELPALQLEIDEHHQHKDVYDHTLQVLERAIALEPSLPGGGPDLVLRLAALLHDIGKPRTRRKEPRGGVSFHHHEVVGASMVRKRLVALRYPKDVVSAVELLTLLHLRFHGYRVPGSTPARVGASAAAVPARAGASAAPWTDSAVRRYVTDAGELLPRLHALVRSDCTTRNRRRAAALSAAYDDLERRIGELSQREELGRIRPDLDGGQIMALLGIGPGPLVGRAYTHLLELRMEHGPLPRERAEAELRDWAVAEGVLPA